MLIDLNTFNFNNPGGFLVLDGVNGAGKTTLLKAITAYINDEGFDIVETKEPGSTQIGSEIRKLLLETNTDAMEHLTEMFLFSADRAEHVSKLIEPALKRGALVISDRYYYSTATFQGYGRELDIKTVENINSIAVQEIYPDLVILLDLDPSQGLNRARQRNSIDNNQNRDSFEEEELEFHKRLRQGFLEIAERYREPFFVLDATKGKEELFLEVKPLIDLWIKSLRSR